MSEYTPSEKKPPRGHARSKSVLKIFVIAMTAAIGSTLAGIPAASADPSGFRMFGTSSPAMKINRHWKKNRWNRHNRGWKGAMKRRYWRRPAIDDVVFYPPDDPLFGENIDGNNFATGAQFQTIPTPEYSIGENPDCREYSTWGVIDGYEEQIYGTTCRQPDGTWDLKN